MSRAARFAPGPFALLLLAVLGAPDTAAQERPLVIGSKSFTESVVLGEMALLLAEAAGVEASHRQDIGGTRLLFEQLSLGALDAYPEYSGTLRQEIFAGRALPDDAALAAALAENGIVALRPFGFNNTYAIGLRRDVAEARGIRRISDLRDHPDLVLRFSNEFLNRGDGWPNLRRHYGLGQTDVQGVEHALAYRALESGSIDGTDLYSTDAEIAYYDLATLEDDRAFFPRYEALYLVRADLAERAPAALAAWRRLEGRIDDATMTALNARAKPRDPDARVSERVVASEFLAETLGIQSELREESLAAAIARTTLDHLTLVGVSLLAAVAVALPLGIVSARRPRLGQGVLGAVGIIQTIPSIAILVMLISPVYALVEVLGRGDNATLTAIAALFLYSLLPIVRNTYTGLHDIDPTLRESAEALGLTAGARLRLIELPMASRTILAGIKTAAVINVGFATLGGFIGAGGYGQPIFSGIRLDDDALILQGALPAAALALLVQAMFEGVERWVVPKGLRL